MVLNWKIIQILQQSWENFFFEILNSIRRYAHSFFVGVNFRNREMNRKFPAPDGIVPQSTQRQGSFNGWAQDKKQEFAIRPTLRESSSQVSGIILTDYW